MVKLIRPVVDVDGRRWAHERNTVALDYPGFRYVERPPYQALLQLHEQAREFEERTQCHDPIRTWGGMIQPFATDAAPTEIIKIMADLDQGLEVHTVAGTLHHVRDCLGNHELSPELYPARPLTESYQLEIACRIPPGHPIVRSLDQPPITFEHFSIDPPPHLLRPLGALCVLYPPDGHWDWDRGDGIREYLDHTAVWLAKHTVWLETRERLGKGRWIGPSKQHGAALMLHTLQPWEPCHCGRARTYRACCLSVDVEKAKHEPPFS